MQISLTATYLDALKLKPGQKLLEVSDKPTRGLRIRVSASKKSWSVKFALPGTKEQVQMSLGTYPATGIATARQKALEAWGHIEAGKDPRAAMAPQAAPKTIAQLWTERLEMKVTGKLRSAAFIEGRYRLHILPHIGNVAVADFRIDPHYNLVLDKLIKRGVLRAAGQVHTDLVTLMRFAVQRGARDYSPLEGLPTPDPKNVKTRWLSLAEIQTFWATIPEAFPLSKSCQRILKLCLATGQRLNEVAGMRRGELDWANMVWTIPASRVKNGKKFGDHTVPLSPLAASIIREALAVNSNETEWLFPNKAGKAALPAHVICTTLRRAIDAGDFSMPKFTAHDLRRTVATQMSLEATGLQVPELYISHVLNHRSSTHGSITARVYNQNTYLPEKRTALVDKWGAFLGGLVGNAQQQREAA